MPISFRCRCGKQMQAKDEFAGRKMRCPACQAVVTIPATGMVKKAPAPAQLPGRGFNGDDAPASSRRAEPAVAGAATVKQPAATRAAGNSWADHSLDQQATPWASADDERRGALPADRPSKLPLFLSMVVAIGLAGAAWYFWPQLSALLAGEDAVADVDCVPRHALGFVSVQVAELWKGDTAKGVRKHLDPKLEEELRKLTGLAPPDIDRLTIVFPEVPKSTLLKMPAANDVPVWALVATAKPYDREGIRQTLAPGAKEIVYKGKRFWPVGKVDGALYFVHARLFVVGNVPGVVKFLDTAVPVKKEGPLQPALAATAKHPIVVGINPPAELLTALPAPFVPELVQPLMGVQSATMTVDDGKTITVQASLMFKDADAAAKAKKAVDDAVELARQKLAELKDLGGKVPDADKAFALIDFTMQSLKVETRDSGLEASMKIDGAAPALLMAMLLPEIQKVRESAGRTQARNNMSQIALALNQYHDKRGQLPPAKIGAGLSWRVAILPYLGEDKLHKEFHLDEPWNSAHNEKLLVRMPQVYAPRADIKASYSTFYQVFTGAGTPFDGKAWRFDGFKDGTANTLLVVEAATPVLWTKPDDIVFFPQTQLNLGVQFPQVFLGAFADGSARFFPRNLERATLSALVSPAGGEQVVLPP